MPFTKELSRWCFPLDFQPSQLIDITLSVIPEKDVRNQKSSFIEKEILTLAKFKKVARYIYYIKRLKELEVMRHMYLHINNDLIKNLDKSWLYNKCENVGGM